MQLLDEGAKGPKLGRPCGLEETMQASPIKRWMAGYMTHGSLTPEISIFSYLEGKILNLCLVSSVMVL